MKTIAEFAEACKTLDCDAIYTLFEDRISDDLRDAIYDVAETNSDEPARDALNAIGLQYNVESLINY